jgi:hypothetical protein
VKPACITLCNRLPAQAMTTADADLLRITCRQRRPPAPFLLPSGALSSTSPLSGCGNRHFAESHLLAGIEPADNCRSDDVP